MSVDDLRAASSTILDLMITVHADSVKRTVAQTVVLVLNNAGALCPRSAPGVTVGG
jgi:hypothetical protein